MALPRVTVVVPTFNERENVRTLAERIVAAAGETCGATASAVPAAPHAAAGVEPPASAGGGPLDILFVDDDSPDGTADEVRRVARDLPVRCLVRTAQRGLATAVIAGLRAATGELVVVMDADLSHPPEAIPRLVEAMGDPGVEMAIGSRFIPGGSVDLHWPLHRRFTSWCGRALARPLTPVRDMVAGFFCVRRADLDLDRLDPIGYKIALELIVRHRWTRVVEVPIAFSDRVKGQTKLNMAEELRYLRHLARLYAFRFLGRGGRSTP